MRFFSRIMAISLGSLMITTGIGLAIEGGDPTGGGAPKTKQLQQRGANSTQKLLDSLQQLAAFTQQRQTPSATGVVDMSTFKARNTAYLAITEEDNNKRVQALQALLTDDVMRSEETTLLGQKAKLEQVNLSTVLGYLEEVTEETMNLDSTARSTAATSFTIDKPIQVKRHLGNTGALNDVNELVVRGCLLSQKEEQEANDFLVVKSLLQRILEARVAQHTKAGQLKRLQSTEATSKVIADEFLAAARSVEDEKERLLQVFFHLRVVRLYMKETKGKVDELRQGTVSSDVQEQINILQNTMRYVESMMHAIYDFDRVRSTGWIVPAFVQSYLEHSAVQAKRLQLTGSAEAVVEFEISTDLMTKYPAFATVVKRLLYKQDSPQLMDALRTELFFFGERLKPVEVATAAGNGWNLWPFGKGGVQLVPSATTGVPPVADKTQTDPDAYVDVGEVIKGGTPKENTAQVPPASATSPQQQTANGNVPPKDAADGKQVAAANTGSQEAAGGWFWSLTV